MISLRCLTIFLIGFSLTSAALAAPLEALHRNKRWVERSGKIEFKVYSNRDSRLVYTAVCDGKLQTSYSRAGENSVGPQAYFSIQTLAHCELKEENAPVWQDGSQPYFPNTVWSDLTVELSKIRSSGGSYSDYQMLKVKTIATKTSVEEVRSTEENLPAFITRVALELGVIQFKYSQLNTGKKRTGMPVIEVTGSFKL